jgi:hyperosmotically inducible periplasmic protein
MERFSVTLLGPIVMATIGFLEPAFVSNPSLAASEPADSTEKNVRDKDNATLTPTDQARGSQNDVELTRRIREALTADKTLSTNAQNIKIVTLNGRMTLRGPVKDAKEQALIVGKASRIVGPSNVVNQLEVTGP